MKNILKYRRCCKKTSKYIITYSCGTEPLQTLLVCKTHYEQEAFHTCIIKIEELEGKDLHTRPSSLIQNLGSDTNG